MRESNAKVADSVFLMREKITSVVRTLFLLRLCEQAVLIVRIDGVGWRQKEEE